MGVGLLLTACTIEVPNPDEYEYETGGGGSDAGDSDAGSGGNSGGTSGNTGTTSNTSAGGATNGGNAGPTSGAGSSSGAGGSSGGMTSNAATTEGGAGDGATGASADDNCPEDASSDQTDTDGDGQGNVCDDDDDQDGFADEEDPEPLDVDVPGDFSTPEKVLADPRMADAIESLREAGFELETYLETNPPDVAGYFRKEAGEGEFVANSGGGGVGVAIIGSESRTLLSENGRLETSKVSFDSEPIAFSIVTGQTLRGTGKKFTIYRTSRSVCTESDSNYVRYFVTIESGKVNANGDLVDVLSLGLTVASQGELTPDCADRANGLTENENEWTAALAPLTSKLEVSDLEYMCVDGDFGYAPTETWSRAAKACECTLDYQVSCAAP